jgi:putative transcriptional regulator
MMQRYFEKKYLRTFFEGVVIPVAVFMAVLSCKAEALGTGNSIFSRQTGIPHEPLTDPSPFDERLSQGKFLVAAKSMEDPRFRETVILLVRYDSNGAMGVIVNVPTGVSISSALPNIRELRKRTDKVFIGGPVAWNQLFMLIRTDKPPEGSLRVFKHTYVSSSMTALRHMARDRKRGDRFRVFAGYAGWAGGQLEREVARGSWYVMESEEKLIFDKEPSDLWQQLISRRSGIMVRLLPGDASGTLRKVEIIGAGELK